MVWPPAKEFQQPTEARSGKNRIPSLQSLWREQSFADNFDFGPVKLTLDFWLPEC